MGVRMTRGLLQHWLQLTKAATWISFVTYRWESLSSKLGW